jgi:hypothetical protein
METPLEVTEQSDPLTNAMDQSSSSEAGSRSASQEILRLLWNLKFHYRVHKNWSLF